MSGRAIGARAGEAGLTLVEMLVVLAIIGIASGATVLGLGFATRGASTAAEANRLAAELRLASDDAMLGDRAMAFTWDGARYGFSAGAVGEGSFASHSLPPGIRLVMPSPSGSIAIGADGAGMPIRARLESSADQWEVRYDGAIVTAAEVPKA